MTQLLPETEKLLLEVLEGLRPEDPALPELRVGKPGRTGARYWLSGRKNKAFQGRRPFAQFEELHSAGLLRKLRAESTGTYFAFTSEAFARRDHVLRTPHRGDHAADRKRRPAKTPPELSEAKPRLDILRDLLAAGRRELDALLDVSSIAETVRNDPNSQVVFIPLHPWRWLELEPNHLTMLGAAKRDLDLWFEAAKLTLAAAGPEHLERFGETVETLRRYTNRSANAAGPPASGIQSARRHAHELFEEQLKILDALPAAHEVEEVLIVPDTNALIADPAIEEWQLGTEPCAVVIVPQVQSELDEKKVAGNDRVRDCAAGLIRRFREYARRGDTFRGVPLAPGRCFREVPVHAQMDHAPSWLNSDHADDRILLSALCLASRHLTSRVLVVTRDRNLQNKARMLRLPAVDIAEL